MVSFTNATANSIPVVSLPFKYVSGLELSFTSTTAISVAAGQCRDSTDTYDLVLPAATSLFISINGPRGLDTGTVDASLVYAVYIIASSIKALPTTTLMSLSSTRPFMPSGYDLYRRIGYIVTNSSTEVEQFVQTSGRKMVYDTRISVLTGGNATTFTALDLSAAVPPIPNCDVLMKATLVPATAGNGVFTRATGSLSEAGASFTAGVVAVSQIMQFETCTGIATGKASLDYYVSEAGDAVNLYVLSYVDQL